MNLALVLSVLLLNLVTCHGLLAPPAAPPSAAPAHPAAYATGLDTGP